MLLDSLMLGSWLTLTVYTVWYLFKAKTFQPLTLEALALTWRFHKTQTGCTASRLSNLITRNDEVVGFKCDCGYEFQQKRLITQNVSKPQPAPQKLPKLCPRTRGKNPVIIALHSFKGGTGKTILSINLATMFAKKGKKVCLMELDFSAPSFFATFKNASNHWVNDYLNKACKAERLLTDCSTKNMGKGKLYVGLADPSTEAIREMASKDRKWEIEALGRLLSLKDILTNEMQFDYVFFDTSPGLQYSSINAIIAADIVLVISSTEKSDVEGTRRMIQDLYEIFQKKTALITNKAPFGFFSSVKVDAHQPRLLGIVPCTCDIPKIRIEGLFAPKNPDHEFTKKMQEIAESVEHLCRSVSCSSVLQSSKVETNLRRQIIA